MCKILGGKLVISKRLPPCHGPLSLIYGCRRCSSPPDLDSAFFRNRYTRHECLNARSNAIRKLVHRVISRRHTAVGQLADFQGGPSRTGGNISQLATAKGLA